MDIIVRQIPFEGEEYRACLAIRRKVFIEEQRVPEKIEIDRHEKSAYYFLAEREGRPVGTGRFRIDGTNLKFERIATLSEERGRGIGRALMAAMQETARQQFPQYTPLMHSQLSAIPFYEKLGWVAVGETFFEADIPHRTMILKNSNHHKNAFPR